MKLLRLAAASLVVAAFGIANAVPSQAWGRVFNLTVQDQTVAVARDSIGSVYVLGRRQTAATNVDWVLLRYSSLGTLLWTRLMDGAAHGADIPFAMTVDKFNNIWVAGSERYLTGDRAVVVKYSPAGAQLRKLWMNKVAAGYDAFHSIAADIAGNVSMTGVQNRPGTGRDFITVKLSQTGTLWWRYWTTSGNLPDEGRKVLPDRYGNVFVIGNSSVTPDNLNRNVVVVKYSQTGALLWTRGHTGPGTNDELSAAILDPADNPILAIRESKGTYSYFSVHKRSSTTGNPMTVVFRYPASTVSHMYPNALARDSAGIIYLATTHYWRSGELTYSRVILTRFSAACARQWERYVSYSGAHSLAQGLLVGTLNSPILFATIVSKSSPASEMRAVRFTPVGGTTYNYRFGRPLPAVDTCVDVSPIGTTAYVGATGRSTLSTTNYDITLFRLNNL